MPGQTIYAYVEGNPISKIDPDGLLVMSTLGGLQRGTTLAQAATYGAPGNAAMATELTTMAVGAVARGGAALTPAAAALAKRLDFDGPSKGLAYGNGRVCQVRFDKQPLLRLDYHPYPGDEW